MLCSVSLEVKGYLTLRCSLKLAPRMHSIRASFCPLLSLEKGEYIGMVLALLFRIILTNVSFIHLDTCFSPKTLLLLLYWKLLEVMIQMCTSMI